MIRRRARIVTCAAALGLVLAVLPVAAQELTDPIRARTFRVEFKPLSDAAELIGPLLTDEGSVMMRPRQKVLIVEDRTSVLLRVGQVLESFDLPPRSVKAPTIFTKFRRESLLFFIVFRFLITANAVKRPNTQISAKLLPPRRLPPCMPAVTSPIAYKFSMSVLPDS